MALGRTPVDQPIELDRYWRTVKPDHEVAPRQPVSAIELISPAGTPFTLVREEIELPDPNSGRRAAALAWCLWIDAGWIGYIGSNVPLDAHGRVLEPRGRITARRSLAATNRYQSVEAYRCWLTDGRREEFAPVNARGQGLMYAAYACIIRDLSEMGWTLSSPYRARNKVSRAMWDRLRAIPDIEIVRSRVLRREFAFFLERNL
jgi:hypothetical protein